MREHNTTQIDEELSDEEAKKAERKKRRQQDSRVMNVMKKKMRSQLKGRKKEVTIKNGDSSILLKAITKTQGQNNQFQLDNGEKMEIPESALPSDNCFMETESKNPEHFADSEHFSEFKGKVRHVSFTNENGEEYPINDL